MPESCDDVVGCGYVAVMIGFYSAFLVGVNRAGVYAARCLRSGTAAIIDYSDSRLYSVGGEQGASVCSYVVDGGSRDRDCNRA